MTLNPCFPVSRTPTGGARLCARGLRSPPGGGSRPCREGLAVDVVRKRPARPSTNGAPLHGAVSRGGTGRADVTGRDAVACGGEMTRGGG